MIKKVIGLAVLASTIGVRSSAETWNMPTPYGDANMPTKIAYQFAEEIKSKTGGELVITVHSGASLIKHPEIPRAVKSGQVQLGEVFIGTLGNEHPVFKHDNMPFVATSYADSEKLWLAAKPEMEKLLKKDGLMLLYAVPWPAQSLYTKFPVASLADLSDSKMRAYSPSTSRLADLMGTTPTTVQVPDIPQAFSTGIIDSMVTSPSTGANGQAWDYLTHYTSIDAWIPKNMVIVNTRAFKRLDKATQAIILEAAANAEKSGWAGVVEQARKDTQTLIDNGIIVTAPSAQLITELKAIGAVMSDEWLAEAPIEVGAILKAYNK